MTRRKKRSSGFAGIPVHEPFIIVERHPQVVTAICLSVLAAIAICAALYVARAYLLPITAALVFAVVLAPLCGFFEWFRIPRVIAALFALIFAGGIVYAGFALIAQPASHWVENAPQTLDKAQRQLKKLREPFQPLQNFSQEVDKIQIMPTTTPATRSVVLQGPSLTQSLLASAQTLVVQAGFVVLLSYFLLITREEFRLKIIAFQPTLRARVRMARVFRDMKRRVGGYIVTFSAINIVVGVCTGLACWQLGLPDPIMFGGIATILNYIPFVGPTLTIALLALAGLSTFDNLLQASFPALAFMAISFVENNAVTPMIMGRRMTLNPLAIILAVSFWTWIWGPVGGLIALPILIMFKVICDHIPAFQVLGALIGAPLSRDKPLEDAIEKRVATAEEIADETLDPEPDPVTELEETTAEPSGPPQPNPFTRPLGATAR
ncbi:MAG TPA: AI-2E family transporter [Hyphomonadaceae bacterium]|jgi:predicted PurR-regulated permease PerM|nr:AI-2E family transporter [Hyphomonadaceae bacterium]